MLTDESREALQCWNMLANGMGGLDWRELDLAVEFFGVDNVEMLIVRLLAIKAHRKPKDDEDLDSPT